MAICWFRRATIECGEEFSFQSIFQRQSDKLSTATSWFKRAIVLYIPAATTAAKLLQYWFFVLEEFKFQYNGLLLYCRACVSNEAYTVIFAMSDKRKGSRFSHDTPRISSRTANSDKTLPKSNARFKNLRLCASFWVKPSLNEHSLRMTKLCAWLIDANRIPLHVAKAQFARKEQNYMSVTLLVLYKSTRDRAKARPPLKPA